MLLPATRLFAARPPGDHVGTGDQAKPLVTAIVIVTMHAAGNRHALRMQGLTCRPAATHTKAVLNGR
jgi:hypothetical protein